MPRIGLALGGGFARGVAHAGVFEALERAGIRIHAIAGVSAGAIAAAAYASGATPEEIARAGCGMRFSDVARWTVGKMGFAASERMNGFLGRLLKLWRFEDMPVRLGVLATDLATGRPVWFRDRGDVCLPIRASCSYPGLFQPVRYQGRLLVDGAISQEVPVELCRALGATHVIAVHLPVSDEAPPAANVFQVVNRCFQILQSRTEHSWRTGADIVIEPDVRGIGWNGFECGERMVAAGREAAVKALPAVRRWVEQPHPAPQHHPSIPQSTPA